MDHLNLKLLIFIGLLQVLRFDFQKFRILNGEENILALSDVHCLFTLSNTYEP